jgi:hypothetical protein
MVKPLQSRYFKLLLVLITGIFVYALVKSVCNHDNLPWQLDYNYSLYLTVDDSGYEHMTGSKSADTADALRIYKVRSKRYEWYGLKELFKKELVFETKDRRYIREFVLAAQKRMEVGDSSVPVEDRFPASDGCEWGHLKEREFDWFYVIMFDNTFKRAGYFLTHACKSQDKEYMQILVPDTSGFGPISYYNESLVPIFMAIHL